MDFTSRRSSLFQASWTLKGFVYTVVAGKGVLHKNISSSRAKHRESDVWQRRFWEHTIRDEADFERHLEYIHYNRVKHGFVSCPHLWEYSSFDSWVQKGMYENDWCCGCCSQELAVPDFTGISEKAGE